MHFILFLFFFFLLHSSLWLICCACILTTFVLGMSCLFYFVTISSENQHLNPSLFLVHVVKLTMFQICIHTVYV